MYTAEIELSPERQGQIWDKYRDELIAHYGGEIDAAKKLYAVFAPVFFAVSMAFLKDIVDWPTAAHKGLIFASWGGLIAVIALTLLSHLLSAEQALKQLHIFNGHFARTRRMLSLETDSPEYQVSQRLQERNNSWLRLIRNSSAGLFLAALVLLILFIGLNNVGPAVPIMAPAP